MESTSSIGRSRPSWWLDAAWLIVGSLLLGGLTSAAQGVLPDSMRSFANSVSGWTLLAVLMISLRRPGLVRAACLGALSFVCLVLGYTFVSELRGLGYSPLFWGAVGLVAGPVVGWSTSAAFDPRPLLSTIGSSLIAGVAITDAVYGLTVIAGTTSPVYWSIIGLVGAAFLVLVAVRQHRRWAFMASQVAMTAGWVAIGSVGYSVLNGR